MKHFVYLIVNTHGKKLISYVGYTKNLKKRLNLHNSSKGAKFTKGRNWIIVYKKCYKNKSEAMRNEHLLKKNQKKRKEIKEKFIKKNCFR